MARGAILQGWLRTSAAGAEVRPVPLGRARSGELIAALAELDLLVASREDLLAEPRRSARAAGRAPGAFGPRPHLVVTDGADGLWLDDPRLQGSRHLPVPRRVEAASRWARGTSSPRLLAMALGRSGLDPGAGLAAAMAGRCDATSRGARR